MVALSSLWLPIILSAVLVFLVSSIIHMLLTYHRTDFLEVPGEDEAQNALRPFAIKPGDYVLPYATSPSAMQDPAFQDKVNKGPVIFMTVLPNGQQGMGQSLVQWFIYSLVVSFFSAYLASHVVASGGEYLAVFRFVGTTAFMGYSFALVQNAIWYKRNWIATMKSMFDGLIYGLVTAGVFGWMWPG